MLYRAALVLTLTVGLAGSARADGMIYRLPADGTWAQYDLKVEAVDGQGRKIELTGSVLVKSVGKVQEGGEDCRWIEIKLSLDQDDGNAGILAKALVPEAHLGRGKSAIKHIKRLWWKQGQEEPMLVEEVDDPRYGIVQLVLAGPASDAKPLPPKTVKSKLGELPCKGVAGTRSLGTGNQARRFTFETRLHKKAPFGVVSVELQPETPENGVPSMVRLTLSDFGTTALSDLPKYK